MSQRIPRPEITQTERTPIDYRMFRRLLNNPINDDRPIADTAETEFRWSGSYRKGTKLDSISDVDIDITVAFRQLLNEGAVREQFRALAKRLCSQHPAISTDKGIFGGIPHIKNVRLSVGDVLAKLYVYGSIQKIVEIYSPHVSEAQVKDAIAYAQDFLEIACDSDESSEIDD
jgi:uncharacterized protein (DUF433 family)